MMDRLIRFSLTNRALVLVAAVILLCFGGYTALRMPVDVFPDLTAPTVTVITEAHGMAPLEVESQVTLPIESAVNGAPGRAAGALIDLGRGVDRMGGVRLGDSPTVPGRSSARSCRRSRHPARGRRATGVVAGDLDHGGSDVSGADVTSGTRRPRCTPLPTRCCGGGCWRCRAWPKSRRQGGGERQYQVVLHPERLQAQGVA
jgi:hypothetical protein